MDEFGVGVQQVMDLLLFWGATSWLYFGWANRSLVGVRKWVVDTLLVLDQPLDGLVEDAPLEDIFVDYHILVLFLLLVLFFEDPILGGILLILTYNFDDLDVVDISLDDIRFVDLGSLVEESKLALVEIVL